MWLSGEVVPISCEIDIRFDISFGNGSVLLMVCPLIQNWDLNSFGHSSFVKSLRSDQHHLSLPLGFGPREITRFKSSWYIPVAVERFTWYFEYFSRGICNWNCSIAVQFKTEDCRDCKRREDHTVNDLSTVTLGTEGRDDLSSERRRSFGDMVNGVQ